MLVLQWFCIVVVSVSYWLYSAGFSLVAYWFRSGFVYWCCIGFVLGMHWFRFGVAFVFIGSVLVSWLFCIGFVVVLCWFHIGFALTLDRFRFAFALVLHVFSVGIA